MTEVPRLRQQESSVAPWVANKNTTDNNTILRDKNFRLHAIPAPSLQRSMRRRRRRRRRFRAFPSTRRRPTPARPRRHRHRHLQRCSRLRRDEGCPMDVDADPVVDSRLVSGPVERKERARLPQARTVVSLPSFHPSRSSPTALANLCVRGGSGHPFTRRPAVY